jgi:putative addiction module component (TIGR02574 family)
LTDGAWPELHVLEWRPGAAGAVIIEVNASWIHSISVYLRGYGAAAGRYNGVVNTSLLDQVRQLSVEEQLEFVEALWDSIGDRNAVPGPTAAQKAELDRRIADHAANPDDVVAWDEVRDSALTRIGR